MCGIAGFSGGGSEQVARDMIHAIKHRGPNDSGVFFRNGVGLSHARLSILDVSTLGHQPMSDLDQNVWIIFNGEIYNFKDLRKDLLQKGYVFKSNSDTEVIIYAYKEYGVECFKKMHGMFALAIFDLKKDELILARDRMGKKPLYWSIGKNREIFFASEIKSLMKNPFWTGELRSDSIIQYLANDYVPTPYTMFNGVYKLEPGYILRFNRANKSFTKERFWDIGVNEVDRKYEHFTNEQLQKKLGDLLAKSVSDRLVADVPVGVFLSGGIDSSLVAYYAKQAKSGGVVNSFSIGFEEKTFDESDYAKMVAKHIGTSHHHKIVTERDALDVIPKIVEIFDEPIADSSIIPTYLLSEFANKNITVALGGDGADELFGGYQTFIADQFIKSVPFLPQSLIKNTLKPLLTILPFSDKNFSLPFVMQKFITGLNNNPAIRHGSWLGSFGASEIKKMIKPSFSNVISLGVKDLERVLYSNSIEYYDRYKNKIGSDNAVLAMYARSYLLDEVLVKTDRASMAASIELRSPFLDTNIVDFAYSLDYSNKVKYGSTKMILRDHASLMLPEVIVKRPKKGFGAPVSKWLRNDLKAMVDENLNSKIIEKEGIFNAQYVDRLVHEHQNGIHEHRKELWNLLMFQLWKNKYIM